MAAPMSPRSSSSIRLDQTVTRVLIRLGGLAALAVVVALAVNLWRTHLYATTDRTVRASNALATAHVGMLDQETGLRAFLVSRQPSLLEPFRAGRQEVSQGDAEMERFVAGDHAFLADYISLRLAQDNWQAQWAALAVAPQAPSGLLPFLDRGKALFDAYRVTDTRLTADLLARIDDNQGLANRVATAGLALEVFILLLALVYWRRARRELRDAVVGPVSAILSGLERLQEGEYGHFEPLTTGPSELRTVSLRLAAVAGMLQTARVGTREREKESAQHEARLRRIVDMGREVAGSLNLGYVLQAVSVNVVGLREFRRCVIWLTDDARGTLIATHDSAGEKGRPAGLDPILVGEQAVGKAARFSRVVGPEEVTHPAVSDPWSCALAVPMIVGARVVGVIEIGMDGMEEIPLTLMGLIDTLSSQAATAIEAARLFEQAEERGKTDPLTLLPNRRDLDRALGAEVARAQRYDRPLAVAMIDIDHFKAVNDGAGHARGDEILQETAAVMRALLRNVDIIYRYGGEEFLAVMPETDAESAFELCDRLRLAVSQRVSVRGGEMLTISCGVAAFPRDGIDARGLVTAADDALYRAKRAGRNRVLAAEAALALPTPVTRTA